MFYQQTVNVRRPYSSLLVPVPLSFCIPFTFVSINVVNRLQRQLVFSFLLSTISSTTVIKIPCLFIISVLPNFVTFQDCIQLCSVSFCSRYRLSIFRCHLLRFLKSLIFINSYILQASLNARISIPQTIFCFLFLQTKFLFRLGYILTFKI